MKLYLYAAALSLLMISTGCSVLTKTQVKEVNKFAVAAKDYGSMPGTVIAEHARIRKVRQVLSASTYFNGDAALGAIQVGLEQQHVLEDRGRKADAALKVLKDYADLLIKLSSDEFTGDLQASAETLGKSIDSGITQYNQLATRNLSLFGSGVAAIVRGIGGIRIRSEQEKALRIAISSADPVVQSMTWTVEETMAIYLDGDQLAQIENLSEDSFELLPGGMLSQEKKEVMDKYRITAGLFEGKQPPCLAMTVADEMEDADDAAALAAFTLKAAESFRNAHTRLVYLFQEGNDLPEAIDEVQVLVEEVKSAQALKEKLDNN
jgi:hypothetical protein